MSTIKSLLVAAAVWTAASVTAAQAEILIGVAGPMTGPYAWSGEQFRTGAELAVQKINAVRWGSGRAGPTHSQRRCRRSGAGGRRGQ